MLSRPDTGWITSSTLSLPPSTSDRPFWGDTPRILCRVPLRMSASMTSTRWPACAMTAARLVDTKVLPTPGRGPEMVRMLFFASSMAKCRLVRRLRSASTVGSAGADTASRCWRPSATTRVPCLPLRSLGRVLDTLSGMAA
ncbi:hypothetical protein D3C75_891530 [compost metagenome]